MLNSLERRRSGRPRGWSSGNPGGWLRQAQDPYVGPLVDAHISAINARIVVSRSRRSSAARRLNVNAVIRAGSAP